MVDFILKRDNLLTKDQCDQIIKWTFDNKTFAELKRIHLDPGKMECKKQ